jgi:hypothetical protein
MADADTLTGILKTAGYIDIALHYGRDRTHAPSCIFMPRGAGRDPLEGRVPLWFGRG